MVSKDQPFLLGAEVFNLLTTGMYDTPLAIYREYIQNATDAIQSAQCPSRGRIDITLDPVIRCIKIRDNGPGLSPIEAKRDLVAVAQSRKSRGTERGFRGIGRLSGLAFAERVYFRTRSARNQNVIELMWDGDVLREYSIENKLHPNEIIEACIHTSELEGTEWPDHFFEVEIKNVARHAASEILDREAVQSYIAEVCPVPLDRDFPFTDEVQQMFVACDLPFLDLDIQIRENERIINRPFSATVFVSESKEQCFKEFERFNIPAIDGENPAALCWLAHTDYHGAIPKNALVRGLRAREGNLQIGDETIFDHLFPEARFNRWCVGEVHIMDSRIVPNGRRDYFEPSPHTRNLENQLEAIARSISYRCRNASTGRHRLRKLLSKLKQTESVYELASSGYLHASDARALVRTALEHLHEIGDRSNDVNGWSSLEQRKLKDLELKLKTFQPKRGRPAFGKVHTSEIGTYRKIFRALADTSPTPEIAMKTIEGVLTCV